MLATAMLAGCQDAPIPGDNTENYFSFSAGVAKTRTEAIVEDDGLTFRWTDRDEVGIYGIQDDRSLGDNYAYTAYPDSEDAANCVFRFSTYGQAYQNVAAGSEFYAYYPYDPAANESTPGALPIVLPAEQQQLTAGSPDQLPHYWRSKWPRLGMTIDGDQGIAHSVPVRTDSCQRNSSSGGGE